MKGKKNSSQHSSRPPPGKMLAATSTQGKLISYRRAKKPPAEGYRSSSRISRVQEHLDSSRLAGSSLRISWLAKRPTTPRILPDPEAYCSWIQIRTWRRKQECDDDLRRKLECDNCSQQISVWGVKRLRGALLLGDDDQHRSPQVTDWGAKRARSALHRRDDYVPSSDIPVLPSDDDMPSEISVWRDWANLGDGPAGLIAERLLANDVADYICFRAVCRPWRLCSTDPVAHGILDRRFHPHQWIMLRETAGSPYCRCFMNVFTGYSRHLDLPELRGHDVFGPTTEGLLVLLDRATCVVRLLNPFTRQIADFPSASTLMTEDLTSRKDLLQVSGAGLASDCTIAVHFRGIRTLAVAKPGDVHWIVVDRGSYLLPAMSFAGRFYCATTQAVMVVETNVDQPPRLVIAAKLTRPFARIMLDTVHLVNNDGKLILVDRQCNGNENRKYKVYQVELDARKMVPVHGLGGRAVFIGIELALSVSPSVFPSLRADAIYLGFDGQMTGILDNSPIHLMDGTADPRQYEDCVNGMPLYEPLDVDDYLSWCVTGYRDTLKDT